MSRLFGRWQEGGGGAFFDYDVTSALSSCQTTAVCRRLLACQNHMFDEIYSTNNNFTVQKSKVHPS